VRLGREKMYFAIKGTRPGTTIRTEKRDTGETTPNRRITIICADNRIAVLNKIDGYEPLDNPTYRPYTIYNINVPQVSNSPSNGM
jgi:hypothetical protein